MELAPMEYTCTGRGLAPQSETVVTVASGIGQSSSGMVMWQNPFPYALTIDILSDIGMMNTDDGVDDQGPFSLLIKKLKGITVNPAGALQVPFSFAPNALEVYKGDIGLLYWNREEDVKVVWKYRIEGIAESFLAHMSTKLTCKARKTLTEVIHVDVSGRDTEYKVDDYEPGVNEEFDVEIVPSARVDIAAVSKFLFIEPVTGIISDSSCALRVTYSPQRTMSMSVDVVIVKKNGGRWRFELLLEATNPEIDGKLFLEANVGDVAHKSLTLPPSMRNAPFSVYFYEPPTVFDVETNNDPNNPEIVISFTPREFGREYVAILIVETEDSQWIHSVHGKYPTYVPPDKSQMKGKVAEELKKVLSPAKSPKNKTTPRGRKLY